MRNLISLTDLNSAELEYLVARAVYIGRDGARAKSLADRAVGLYFSKSSTRTRTSFWAGAARLGAHTIAYGPDDLQLVTGETLQDTARVLSQYLDALVVRTNGPIGDMRSLSANASLSVVNALSECEHPTQAIADLATIAEEFGSLAGRHVLCVGEGNSSATALAYAAALTPGLRLTLLCPDGYGVPENVLETVERLGADCAQVAQYTDINRVRGTVDAIYTSRWQTMGVPKEDADWLRAFEGFRIDEEFVAKVASPHTVFLHDLPAVRGQEVSDDVLDGARSRAWRQARHKMTAAMSVLEWCITGTEHVH
ncbi:ornithine carbamoyltransferase [Saccharomonospora marina XMU15]|uniref:Ornithine carbamoyltransferase n=1 Tax=Saccharomonospora marina XMU15 TaxID=882083 RepID=H5X7R2_9PSEU|nr:ornithine carbamoyltransferase [Saccharomonospora marina]EHR51355.1 ornithine carbamoyltransferase [Saccharomonospora marina XMU15]